MVLHPDRTTEWAEQLRQIAQRLVLDPQAVHVESAVEGDRVVFVLRAAASDYGRLIGKGHTHFTALVTLTRAWARRHGMQVGVRVADAGPPRGLAPAATVTAPARRGMHSKEA